MSQQDDALNAVLTDVKAAEAARATGQSGLSTPKETVTVKIFAVLNDKNAEGANYTLPVQDIKMDRPKGAPDMVTVAQAWGMIAQMGGLHFTDNEDKHHIYPMSSVHHLEIEVGKIVCGVTLA